jgi:hypothetical protein
MLQALQKVMQQALKGAKRLAASSSPGIATTRTRTSLRVTRTGRTATTTATGRATAISHMDDDGRRTRQDQKDPVPLTEAQPALRLQRQLTSSSR